MSWQQLYAKRFAEHISHANTLYQSGDYVQAGEKVWGALSALINSRSKIELKSRPEKERFFLGLFNKYRQKNPNLRLQMQKLGFTNDADVFDAVFGLHKFFYGGANFTNQQLSARILFFIQIIENL